MEKNGLTLFIALAATFCCKFSTDPLGSCLASPCSAAEISTKPDDEDEESDTAAAVNQVSSAFASLPRWVGSDSNIIFLPWVRVLTVTVPVEEDPDHQLSWPSAFAHSPRHGPAGVTFVMDQPRHRFVHHASKEQKKNAH